MVRRFVISAWLLVLASICFTPDPAAAAGRVALVIGNSAYRSVPQLPNPETDAADVAASLGRLGFSVDLLKDASFDELRRALISFGAKAQDADLAVIYFAGHGMEVAGENWIIPVDAALATDRDIENEAIGLKSMTLAVSGARGLGLVILDACRNNPFDGRMRRNTLSRAVSRGLAPIEPTGNVLVAFAAKDGTTAADGGGRNSPFTAALLNHLETPGLEIDFLLRNVRDDVIAATNGQQQPFAYGSLSREAVYLQPAPTTTSDVEAGPPADDIAWPFVAAATDPSLVRRFTAQFPASRHRAEADQRLATLEAAAAAPPQPVAATQSAKAIVVTPEQGALARRFNASAPQIEAAWSLVKTSADPASLMSFTAEFPSRERRTVAAALNGIGSAGGVLRQLRAEDMHAVLSDYGRFVQHQRYGEVWVPAVVPTGWHPYEPCHWVATRQFDWFYLDRTPWGAIVHHFGRWTHDDQLGWIWIPGVDFSPGWVVWRATSQQIGWAPMPPTEDLHTSPATQPGSADFWTFMERGDFTRGCGATTPAGLPLKSAVFVRALKIAGGLPVSVLPFALPASAVDVDVAFDPWPAWLVNQTIVDWNQLWSAAQALCPMPTAPAKVNGSHPPLLPVVHSFRMPTKPRQDARPIPEPASLASPARRRALPIDRDDEPVIGDPRHRASTRRYYPVDVGVGSDGNPIGASFDGPSGPNGFSTGRAGTGPSAGGASTGASGISGRSSGTGSGTGSSSGAAGSSGKGGNAR